MSQNNVQPELLTFSFTGTWHNAHLCMSRDAWGGLFRSHLASFAVEGATFPLICIDSERVTRLLRCLAQAWRDAVRHVWQTEHAANYVLHNAIITFHDEMRHTDPYRTTVVSASVHMPIAASADTQASNVSVYRALYEGLEQALLTVHDELHSPKPYYLPSPYIKDEFNFVGVIL